VSGRGDDGLVELVTLVLAAMVGVVWLLVRRPRLVAVLIGASLVWWGLRVPGLVAVAAAALVVGLVWRLAWPGSFARLVSAPLRRSRRRRRYRAGWRHQVAAHRLSWAPHPKTQSAGHRSMVEELTARPVVPKLERIELGDWLDRLTVRILPGQTPTDSEAEVEGLAHAYGARDGRIRVAGPGRVTVELAYGDPLAQILAPPAAETADVGVVPVGRHEDGTVWSIRLAGSHVLVAGDTGSGKGSVTGSIIASLCPAIAAGLVEIHAVDPKGGQELLGYQPLLAELAWRSFEDMVALLESQVTAMQARAGRLAGTTRTHQPSVDEPLVVVLVDEVAALTAYAPDRKLRDRVTHALSLLLTQGRAVGFAVVAALQDPRKEVLGMRNLFPTRVALRLNDPGHADMVLGDSARDMGARCDLIADSQPGVGYVKLDGQREPRRVRAAWISDDYIRQLCARYGRSPAANTVTETVGAA
jgi:S-DNA-T family DNA segregation ATPase FtsK/SpoIIIE